MLVKFHALPYRIVLINSLKQKTQRKCKTTVKCEISHIQTSQGLQGYVTAGVKRIDCDSAKAFRAYLCCPTNDQ